MKKVILLIISLFFFTKTSFVYGLSAKLPVSASIGHSVKIFGYTSPQAEVEVTGPLVYEKTTADNKGSFEFEAVYFANTTSELCLTARDRAKRGSMPVCVPAPDFLSESRAIGPVILPPTITIDKGSFFTNQQTSGTGESMPDTEINVSLFRNGLFDRNITVYAASVPQYSIKTDQSGYFSFNLPSAGNSLFRLFAQAQFDNSMSPKSNTLTFKVISIWYFIKLFLLVLLIAALIARYIYKHRNKNSKALVLDQKSIQVYSKDTLTV